MMLLLLLGSLAMSMASPTYQCDLHRVAIVGGNYTVSEDGKKVEYSCPKGMYPFPSATRECQGNGQWTNEKKAVCKAIECPKPVMFEGGEVNPRKVKYVVGDVLYFDCWGGFTMFGPENRTCQENGKWSGETTKCDDQEGHCPNPGIPIGASKVGTSYRIEGKVSYGCQNGLKMFGSKIRECKENKRWSGTEPSCRTSYTYDTPEEVSKTFASSLAETIESSDPDRVEGKSDRKLQVTTGGLMNIFIIIDASKSVGQKNFNTAKGIAEVFIDKVSSFDFVPRYSVLTYASQVKQIVRLSESEINTDGSEVIEAIKRFKYKEHEDKQGTNTRGALQEVYNQLSLDNLRDPGKFLDYSNIILLMTDGKHNMGGDPSVEANKIREFLDIKAGQREDKLDIYVFGLGADISQDELNDIASKKDREKHVFQMKDIDAMKKAFDDIIDETSAFEMCGLAKNHSEEDTKENNEKFPWIAKLTVTRPGGVENCKGSIVTKNFILTAAHCFHLDDEPHYVTVELGPSDRAKVTRKVENIYRHPKYDPNGKADKNIPKSFDYDLALVEMKQKIEFSSTVRPICLPCTSGTSWALKQRDKAVSCKDHETFLLSGDLVKALFITEEKKNSLKQMNVQIKQGNWRQGCLKDAEKVKDFKDVADIKDVVTDNFLCTGGVDPEVDPQTCKGDSGGPLIKQHNMRYIQVGVISWGTVGSCDGYTRKQVPADSRDFHASVIPGMEWMKGILKDELIYLQ